ncbi:Transgelin [Drechslerella dactyloides]|uniref:Transgelin n=1 Tax=Drechslerella dactyloides TaxID=74499 RepID=A0AAD6IVR2_DREDA|nr:Transgelin [Drechslerella dactyloides]
MSLHVNVRPASSLPIRLPSPRSAIDTSHLLTLHSDTASIVYTASPAFYRRLRRVPRTSIMASVTSLDKDLAKLRLSKYTSQAANEAKAWIESVLGESLGDDDLMDSLHDGTVLCRLANKLIPGSTKLKHSEMPFVQMENIAMFLRVCSDVLKISPHDLFLTVDLYEFKDPAQVLQTIGAFSRIAHSQNPSAFPTAIGPKASNVTPNATGKARPPVPSKTNVSSWSKPSDELTTAPAWNIHQYGYMGGASQGSQGVVIGARRQITTTGPQVPSLREKEERRKQYEEEIDARAAEEERERQRREEELWLRKEETSRKKRADEEAAARARRDAELQAQDGAEREKARLRQEAHALREAEDAKRRDYERRLQEERASRDRRETETAAQFFRSSNQEHAAVSPSSESDRIKELERQLEEARERERAYLEKQQPSQKSTPRTITPPNDSDERDLLRTAWQENQSRPVPPKPTPAAKPAFTHSARAAQRQREMQDEDEAEERKSASPAPPPTPPRNTAPAVTTSPLASTRWGFKGARGGGGSVGKAAGGGTMSIVQREMELERQRQKEWERNQEQLAEDRKVMTDKELKDGSEMPWDIHQYGYLGGANQGTEQVAFGARRQIIGPKGSK